MAEKIILESLEGKIIEHKGKEYIVNSTKKVLERNILYTDKETLALFYSDLQNISIIRQATKEDFRKARERNNAIKVKQKFLPKVDVSHKSNKEKKNKIDVKSELTQEDIDFIIENWVNIGTRGCKKELEVNQNLILKVVEDNNLREKKKEIKVDTRTKDLSEVQIKFLKENWQELPLHELADKLKISIPTVRTKAKELDLPVKVNLRHKVKPKVFEYNEEATKNSDIKLYNKIDGFKPIEQKDKKVHSFNESEKEFIRKNWNSMSIPEFCQHYSLSLLVFNRSIEGMGLEKKKARGRTPKSYSEETTKQIKELWATHTPNQIQKKLGITYMFWNKHFESLNLPKKEKIKKEKVKTSGRSSSGFTEEQIKQIKELWQDNTANQIQQKLGISYFIWPKNIGSLNLPTRTKKKVEKSGRKQRVLSEDEIKTIRENWMHKDINWICSKLDISYILLNKLTKPLGLPAKRKIRSGKKKDLVEKLSKTDKNSNLLNNYKDLMKIILDSQSNNKIIILKEKDGLHYLINEKNETIWKENQISDEFKPVNYFKSKKFWDKEDDSKIRKSLLEYNRRRNIHIQNNMLLNVKCFEVFPIKYEEYLDLKHYQSFSDFLEELSKTIGRRVWSIKKRYENFNLIEFNEILKPENVTKKN